MIEKLNRLKEKIRDAAGNPAVIEIWGLSELLITGCISLEDYSDDCIIADTVSGRVMVKGKKLNISVFRSDLLSIKGAFENISFLGGES